MPTLGAKPRTDVPRSPCPLGSTHLNRSWWQKKTFFCTSYISNGTERVPPRRDLEDESSAPRAPARSPGRRPGRARGHLRLTLRRLLSCRLLAHLPCGSAPHPHPSSGPPCPFHTTSNLIRASVFIFLEFLFMLVKRTKWWLQGTSDPIMWCQ